VALVAAVRAGTGVGLDELRDGPLGRQAGLDVNRTPPVPCAADVVNQRCATHGAARVSPSSPCRATWASGN
jgi:hypothetical protein